MSDKYAALRIGRRDRGHRRANGTVKRPYPEQEATVAAERQNAQGRGPVRAYKCRSCEFWHIGGTR